MPRSSRLKVIEPPVDTEIVWRRGSHPPKNVDAATVKAAIDELYEPSPEALLEAAKNKKHCLHEELYSEGDQIWAQRGRLERCRHILGDLAEIVVIGGQTIEIRAVEWLRATKDDEQDIWATLEDIRADTELFKRYLKEVRRLQDQASAKLAKALSLQ